MKKKRAQLESMLSLLPTSTTGRKIWSLKNRTNQKHKISISGRGEGLSDLKLSFAVSRVLNFLTLISITVKIEVPVNFGKNGNHNQILWGSDVRTDVFTPVRYRK